MYSEPLRCTGVLLYWWKVNKATRSWKPIVDALMKIGLLDLAHNARDHFTSPSASAVESLEESTSNGLYCTLCNHYHLVDHSIDDVPSKYQYRIIIISKAQI